jgi:hypothetical protein
LTNDDVADAKGMVEFEIATDPAHVGPPIDVLEITANGPRWIEQHICK